MQRRKFLISCSAISTGLLAGCEEFTSTENQPPEETPIDNTSDESDDSDNSDDSENNLSISDYSFEQIVDGPEKTSVKSIEDNQIIVEGTVSVPNGCKTIEVSEEPYITDDMSIKTTISSVNIYAEDENKVCTQAIRAIGYRLTISVDSSSISTIVLSENGMEETTKTLSLVEN